MAKPKGVTKIGGVYYIRFDLPSPDGKRRQRKIACPGMNQKQAEAFRQEKLREIRYGTYYEPSSELVSSYLESWLERMRTQLAATTWESYSKHLRAHVIPAIGDRYISQLTPAAVQHLYDHLLKRGGRSGRGLSPKTVRNIHGILHGAFGQAVKLRILDRNPVSDAEPPRVVRPEIRTASVQDITRLVDALEGSKYRLPVVIATMTGMRRGEVLALQWRDFDPASKTLHVRRSLAQTSGRVFSKETKTGRARVVAIPDALVAILEDEKREHERRRKFLRGDYPREGWICCNTDGTHLSPQGWARSFGRIVDSLGLSITIHSLRHTQATSLIMAGIPVKVVSELLGHSQVGITQDTYTHVLPHMQHQAANVIGDMLGHLVAKKQASES